MSRKRINPAPEQAAAPAPEQAAAPAPEQAAAPAPEQAAAPAPEQAAEPAIFVRSRAPHFHRAGYRFDRDGIGLALNCLTEEQLKAITEEPALIVEQCTFDLNEADATK